tara:strand:+ start:169 stop:996 length:828 start_codon:yes stop_codon:yes gene_type:complete
MKRKTIIDIKNQKGKEPIVCLTAYTAPIARAIDKYVDILLVGDSLGMVLYDYENTLPVTLNQMIEHSKSVVRASENACVIADMPFGTYEESISLAFNNAARIMKETHCDGIKLEGGQNMFETVKYLTDRSIPVMGHIGLQPQSVVIDGGYKIKGKNKFDWNKYIDDAKALEEAGAFSMVLEGMAEPLATEVTSKVNIPTIGIGASLNCDGQILVTEDMIGLTNITPKFVKEYINVGKLIEEAANTYSNEVRNKKFPTKSHTYAMNPTIIKSNQKK